MISTKLFCTQKLFHKDWIHQNININNKDWRLYDTSKYGCEQIFWNEIGWFFEYMLNQNLKIYYVQSSPKHNIEYTDEFYNFFKNCKKTHMYDEIPFNLKKLRELQCNDLMYFYQNLILESFFIISKIKNNLYYYDMVIIVKNDFDINNFYKINFNIINIKTITPIFYNNITYKYMQQIFDFTELSLNAFCDIQNQDYLNIIYNPKFKETQEYKNLEKYKHEQEEIFKNYNYQHNDPLFWYYRNDYNGVVSEMLDQKAVFKHYFLNFGWQWYTLNYNFEDNYAVKALDYTYPVNEPFLLTLDAMAVPMAVVTSQGEVKDYDQLYDVGCVLDLLMNLNEHYYFDDYINYSIRSHIISAPKIKYNTSYKCRLNKNE